MKENMPSAKIAVVVFEDIFVPDGFTVRVHRVLEILRKSYNITVIACTNKKQTKLKGMEGIHIINAGTMPLMHRLIPFPFKLIPIVLWNLKLALILLKNRFDIVYCAHDWLGFLSVYLLSKVRKYKITFEAHCINFEGAKELRYPGMIVRSLRSLDVFIVKHSDFVIALSNNILEFYQAYNRKIALIPVFVDSDMFKTEVKLQRPTSKLIGLLGPFGGDYSGTFVNLRRDYCLNFIYERIEDFDARIKFVIVGRCDKRMRHDRITYTGYLDSIQDYAIQLSRLDAVLVPEGVPTTGPLNKIIEPMSCSLPVFTTPKGMIGLYWVESGKDILVHEESELVNKINKLIFDDALMASIGRNARKVVEQYYSKEANERKLLGILQSVMDE